MSAATSGREENGEAGFDRILGFTLPARDTRGRCVRLGPVLDTILSAHDYPSAVKHVLAEALVLTAMMGSLGKDSGSQLTLQAQTRGGVIDLLVCDYRDGELRGYVRHDGERFAALGANPSLRALFGDEGYLAITFDVTASSRGSAQRYQGIVPLEGDTLAQACESYFLQSEQLPTVLRVAVRSDGVNCVAGGLLLQHLPEGEEGRERLHVRLDHPDWEHAAIMGGSVRHDELVDSSLSLEALLWRLFHEETELRTTPLAWLERGCRCSNEHYSQLLSRFAESELQEMRESDGKVHVDCAFCSRVFAVAV